MWGKALVADHLSMMFTCLTLPSHMGYVFVKFAQGTYMIIGATSTDTVEYEI